MEENILNELEDWMTNSCVNCESKYKESCMGELWECRANFFIETIIKEREAKKELLECVIKLYKNLKYFGSNISKENAGQLIEKYKDEA